MTSVVDLDELLRKGWPAHAEVRLDGWIARLSGGVTQRANSVVPLAAPPDLAATLDLVEQLYRDHGITPAFQLGPATRPEDLDAVLARRGYELRNPTSIQTASIEEVLRGLGEHHPAQDPAQDLVIGTEPDRAWMDLWWAVDGRGDEQARAIARQILTAGPALYAAKHDASGATAIGRLALVGDWAGLYCLAVRPDCRRQGLATEIIGALLARAAVDGVRHTWLQVMVSNSRARALYARLGFRTAAEYHYRALVEVR